MNRYKMQPRVRKDKAEVGDTWRSADGLDEGVIQSVDNGCVYVQWHGGSAQEPIADFLRTWMFVSAYEEFNLTEEEMKAMEGWEP